MGFFGGIVDFYLMVVVFDVGVKLVVGGMFLFFFYQWYRKVVYYWGFVWIIYVYVIIGDLGIYFEIVVVLFGFFLFLILQGVLRVNEEVLMFQDYIWVFLWGLVVIGVYIVIFFFFFEKMFEIVVMGIVYGVFGVFLSIGGFIFYWMREFYDQDIVYFGLFLSMYGVY